VILHLEDVHLIVVLIPVSPDPFKNGSPIIETIIPHIDPGLIRRHKRIIEKGIYHVFSLLADTKMERNWYNATYCYILTFPCLLGQGGNGIFQLLTY
jgi:hypothetical protein